MIKQLLTYVCTMFLFISTPIYATDFLIGNTNELQLLLSSGTAKAGDTIFLKDGVYSTVTLSGSFTQPLTIKPDTNAKVIINGLYFKAASNIVVQNVDITNGGSPLLDISEDSHHITVENSRIYSALSSQGWGVNDWKTKARAGVVVNGDDNVIRNNLITNILTGLRTAAHANRNIISGNQIKNFGRDGIMETGDYNTFENNRITNSIVYDGNHPDGFQAYGHGNMTGTIIRGNYISGYEADHPNPALYTGTLQGIGCFSTYVNYTIENNTVKVDHGIGAWILGSTGSKVINNTILRNGKHTMTSGMYPGIRLYFTGELVKHRNSINNIVKGNKALDYWLKNKDGSSVCAKAEDCAPNTLTK